MSAEQFGVKILVDRMSVPYLSEAKIDFVDSLEQSGFTIDNRWQQAAAPVAIHSIRHSSAPRSPGRTRLSRPFALAMVVAVVGLLPVESAAPAPAPAPWSSTAGDIGEWSAPVELGVIGIHAALLHTGQVLLWQYPLDNLGSEAHLYDPVTGDNVDVSLNYRRDIFCGGLSIMPDGRVLVTGGMKYGSSGDDGTQNVTIFDPITQTWSVGDRMARARWYPTNVQMPDGTTLVLTGQQSDGHIQRTMESFDPAAGTWTTLPPSANRVSDLYAKMVVLPDGRVFRAGPQDDTRMFDPFTDSWSFVSQMNYGYRSEGAVVLLPGLDKVLTAGGFRDVLATDTAEVIDFSQPSPQWAYTGSLNKAREQLNLVILADGTVLAVGGGTKGGYSQPVKEAELYDPATGLWTLMAAQQAQRMYHSTALLLPDGRVLSAGSDHGPLADTVEIYSPPYLFHGPRPTITSAPASVTYGQTFTITTPNAGDITRVALIRPGAVTHTNNFDQRYVDLSFTSSQGTITATAPAGANMAPPGYYMLFMLNSAGVPAVAPFVQLG